jgi:integrase/recombinase XerD
MERRQKMTQITLETHPLYSTIAPVIQSWYQAPPTPPSHEPTFRDWRWHEGRSRGLTDALTKLSEKDIPGKDLIERYLRDQYRRLCSPSTLRNSLTAIDQFVSFLKAGGKSQLEEITRDDLGAWIEHEQDRGIKPSTVKMRLRNVNAFLRYLIEAASISPEVLSKRMIIKLPDGLPRAIDPDDLNRLLAVVDSIRDRAMILVLLRTGMRIGELLDTVVEDVNLKERRIAIYEAAKTRVGRVVYLSDDARASLESWLEERQPHQVFLFYGQGRYSLSYQAARAIFIKYLARAELLHKGYTLHSCRHTCATELLNAGMRLECVQQLLGHSSIEMTRRYARLTDKTREQEYFRAMTIIERRQGNADHHRDYHLPQTPQAAELLSPYGESLYEHPETVRDLGQCTHRGGNQQEDPSVYRPSSHQGAQGQDHQLPPGRHPRVL